MSHGYVRLSLLKLYLYSMTPTVPDIWQAHTIYWLIDWMTPPPISNQESSLFLTMVNPRKPTASCNYPRFHISLSITHLKRKYLSLPCLILLISGLFFFPIRGILKYLKLPVFLYLLRIMHTHTNSNWKLSISCPGLLSDWFYNWILGKRPVSYIGETLKYQPFFTGHSVSSEKSPSVIFLGAIDLQTCLNMSGNDFFSPCFHVCICVCWGWGWVHRWVHNLWFNMSISYYKAASPFAVSFF